ncbi:MAG TPA: hypothetical protein EYG92_00380 [Lutibacter sp.]|nr:hypothetical protein [Lutibacter sp.]
MKAKIVLIVLISLLFVTACNKKDANYKKNLATADSLFKAEKYEEAKTYYTSILKKNPKDKLIKKKMAEVTAILNTKKKESDFQDVKLEADNLFDAENYEEAKLSYEKALVIMPDNEEAKNRLKDIEFLLANNKDEDTRTGTESNKAYHVIVGCFKYENNAVRLNESLKSRGLDSYLIPRGNLTAVTYSSHNTIHEAYNNLEHVVEDSLQDAAWVFKQNN